MKQFIKYIFLILALATGFYSCKKDLGSYSYSPVDMPVMDTAGVPLVYNVEQYNTLTITPKVNYKGDTSNLSYQWLVYVKSPSSFTIGPPMVIAETKKLDKKIEIAPGNYYLELVITEKSTGVKTNSRSLFNVLAIMENGWLVLHTKDNKSDVDFISNPNLVPGSVTKRLKNLAQTQTGTAIDGEAQVLGYARRSNSLFNWITVGTDKEIKRFNGFNFSLTGANQALFRRPITSTNYQGYINNGSNEILINNGLLQIVSWGAVQDALYSGVFNGDYYLAPYIVFNDFSPYGALVYDQKNGKFIYTTQTVTDLNFVQFKTSIVTVPAQAFNPLSVGKDMLFMDRGFNKYAYAFFKDKTGNGRYLYVLNVTKADAGDQAVASYDMTSLPEILDARFWQVGDVGNVALYATEKTVYRFDYSGSQAATVAFSGIPSNETITNLKIFKPRLNQNSPAADFAVTNNAVVYVATWNGTQGKLYELAMNVASGVIDPTPLNVYEGFGKIKDMTAKFRGTGI